MLLGYSTTQIHGYGKYLANKNVLSCFLNAGNEVDAVIEAGKLFHARATITRNEVEFTAVSH